MKIQGNIFASQEELERDCTNELKIYINRFMKSIENFRNNIMLTDSEKQILNSIDEENESYRRWEDEHPVDGIIVLQSEADAKRAAHLSYLADYNRELEELKKQYAYLEDLNGSTDESRLVIYIEDYAGNGYVVGDNDLLSTSILARSFSIDITRLGSNH